MATGNSAASSSPGFDFTWHVRRLCSHFVCSLPGLSHIDLPQVAFSFAQARNGSGHGVLASLTPMRFADGSHTTTRHGRQFTAQRLFGDDGHEYLYILTVYLPRLMTHSLKEKVHTLLHELWHISPDFNGDLRRFAGRCYAHGPSEKAYEAQVAQLADQWWNNDPPPELYAFLRFNFPGLQSSCGPIYGTKIPAPKLLPVSA